MFTLGHHKEVWYDGLRVCHLIYLTRPQFITWGGRSVVARQWLARVEDECLRVGLWWGGPTGARGTPCGSDLMRENGQ